MKVLLDTNAYSALMRGHPVVAETVKKSTGVLLSSVVVGELLFGFRGGTQFERNLRALHEFLEDPNVELLPVTWSTAEAFAQISSALKRRGRPIPTNDIWIAAHTLESGAELMTCDRHFDEVEGLPKQIFPAA